MAWGKVLSFCLLALGASPAGAAEGPTETDFVPAVILKVEGDGIAHVRKRSGVVETAGARGMVYPGDKVLTDGRSAVYLMLNDGSVLKVGFNSELSLAQVENQGRFLSWLFRLARGSLRALVEKIPSGEMHLRVDTPSGTVGVRGTEFVLAHDEGAGSTYLYMIEGLVRFGAVDCEATKSCQEVRGGEASSILKGKPPATSRKFDVREMFGLGERGAPGSGARLELFRDVPRASQGNPGTMTDPELRKILDDAMTDLAAAQDRAIGRTRAERDAIYAAMKDGRYARVMAAADAYADAKGLFKAGANGGAENLVAQTAASKFRLGLAVVAADIAGAFTDKPDGGSPENEWSGRSFKEKKSVPYEQGAGVKKTRESLRGAAADYRDTLEYAEAVDEKQVKAASAAEIASGADAAARQAAAPAERCSLACENRRVGQEVETIADGSAAAFANRAEAAAAAPVAGQAPRRGRGGTIGSVQTRYFSRSVPGNACTATRQHNCRMVRCSKALRGKKCSASEVIQQCETKVTTVRCPEQQ